MWLIEGYGDLVGGNKGRILVLFLIWGCLGWGRRGCWLLREKEVFYFSWGFRIGLVIVIWVVDIFVLVLVLV